MDTISAFARRVGLTPSALRFYDDCGVLPPARVDPDTGYRYYSADQEHAAALLRTLRQAEVPLADITAVLTGAPSVARDVLTAHARRLRARADSAHAAVEAALRMVELPTHGEVSVGGAELASAIRQVQSAAARSGDIAELRCVLVEWTAEVLRLGATDRYRLAVRELVPTSVVGPANHVLVPVDALVDALPWAVRHDVVRCVLASDGARLVAQRSDGDPAELPLPSVDGEFPDYRLLLDALPARECRVVTDRVALLDALAAADGTVVVETAAEAVHVGERTVPAVCSGTARLGFDPTVLAPAVDAGVGPDVLLEIVAPDRPTIVRSADQGSFTTLVMPVLLD